MIFDFYIHFFFVSPSFFIPSCYMCVCKKSVLLYSVYEPYHKRNSFFKQGGLPYWLLRMNATMQLRTSDPSYLKYVERWYRRVLPTLRDLTYANGGPIISAQVRFFPFFPMLEKIYGDHKIVWIPVSWSQVENEYGWVGSDLAYKEFLRDLFRELLGPDIILFTTDGCLTEIVEAGRVNGTLTTVDFGTYMNVTWAFLNVERKFNPDGPLVNRYSQIPPSAVVKYFWKKVHECFYLTFWLMWLFLQRILPRLARSLGWGVHSSGPCADTCLHAGHAADERQLQYLHVLRRQ